MIKKYSDQLIAILIAAILFTLCFSAIFRIDLSSDKRYSISDQTKRLLKSAEKTISITVYLDGDLNPGFQRLKTSTRDMLEEMSVYADKDIEVSFENPSKADNETERQKRYAELESLGMTPTAIYERDKEGKAIQKIVFPWIKIVSGE